MMRNFLELFIDFVFPPTPAELQLRTISPADFASTIPKASLTEFPFIHSVFSYKNELVKELIWQIKYKKNKKALQIAGHALYQYLLKTTPGPITLIPIPISRKRRKERGYNQTELLIDEIMKFDTQKKFNKDFDLLIRVKDIEKQTFKDRSERIENAKKIFEVTKKNSSNKIILIDDVTTTGSTLLEAHEVLSQAGYHDVTALTIAH